MFNETANILPLSISELNKKYSNFPEIRFVEYISIGPVMEVNFLEFSARISLWGGQVLSWQPKHTSQEVLWSPIFDKCHVNRAIRGGAPICWPWFGDSKNESENLPSHGYARILPWSIVSIDYENNSALTICLELNNVSSRFSQWHERLRVFECITIGDKLSIEIVTKNIGTNIECISEGLHTYLNISDVSNVHLSGLENDKYFDLITSTRGIENSQVMFANEFGRIYLNSQSSCYLYDKKFSRRIVIDKNGSDSTAVWNPWIKKASLMDDLGPIKWRHMICVESANAMDNSVLIKPLHEHSMKAIYSVENIN